MVAYTLKRYSWGGAGSAILRLTLLVQVTELQCGCPFILDLSGVDACLSLPGSDAPQWDV